jgi:hypothetical protein
MTIDWEGAEVTPEAFDSLDALREAMGDAPMTHFMSAAYFTRDPLAPAVVTGIVDEVRPNDELAVHLHAWRSLAIAAGVTPKTNPSFLSGKEPVEFDKLDDVGFETDPDAYTVPELRAMVRTSRKLIERFHHPIASTFRTGGYIGTAKMLAAIGSEGFHIDSSAVDARHLDDVTDKFWLQRLAQLWPSVDPTTQPYVLQSAGGSIFEMPIAATADYASADKIYAILEAAIARQREAPNRDVFVVLSSHFETGPDYAARLGAALKKLAGDRGELVFATVDGAAELARSALTKP